MAQSRRIRIPPEVRKYVLERDGSQCKSCGCHAAEAELTIDHIIPLAKGGTDDISNFQTLCRSCNSRKKHHLDPRFRRHFDQ
ncbi:MAG: HNH endonuclease [Oscillatoriophycideae cyanobacterium NC_groundwater_1537_Pr4_S-0.65um_50_18]|nr:HNH endonuclease [Oscillatoriophycideae cyanobacterium NC_groundwater_1537_Pr4_S-0.65um_50_18]